MCNRASFIAIRGGRVAWLIDTDSHDKIVKAEGLEDKELCDRRFIRIECKPKGDLFSQSPLDWEVTEDEGRNTLPAWYDREEWIPRILDELILRRIPEERRTGVVGNLTLDTAILPPWLKKVGGDLDLRSVTSLPEGFAPTVGGDLDLLSVTSLPEGFAPTVGGDLYLLSVTSLPEGFAPTVGGDLYLSSVTSLPEGFAPTVGGDLYLHSVTSLPEGFAPTVGGDLYLHSVKGKIPKSIKAGRIIRK
jgi:hypothetical protein